MSAEQTACMEDYVRHVFICTSTTCAEGDPFGLRLQMSRLLRERLGPEFEQRVKITKTLCLGHCGLGPNMVVYPEGVWYKGVRAADIPEIVERHLIGGQPVERLVLHKLGPRSLAMETLPPPLAAKDPA